MKILVADDEAIILFSLKCALEAKGYEVITVSHGLAAMDIILAAKDPFDRISLLITDINMPVMTGLELVERVRKLDSKIPIVAMSGDLDTETKTKLVRMGVAKIVKKPFNSSEILEEVQRVLKENE